MRHLLSLLIVLLLSSCSNIGAGSPLPIPTGSVILQVTPLPAPTRADGRILRFQGILVTPLPEEEVRIGSMTELSLAPQALLATPRSSRYLVQAISQGNGADIKSMIVVHDTESGRQIRFGDESGFASLEAQNEDFVIWWWSGSSQLKPGLYAYQFTTGEQKLIANWLGQYPKIDGDWVIYSGENPYYLNAHNLKNGTDILIAKDLAHRHDSIMYGPSSRGDYYMLRGNKVVYVAETTTNQSGIYSWGLRVYDLSTGVAHILKLPESMGTFFDLNIFGDVVIWQQDFWQGYDLQRDAYFSIPIIPVGWENMHIEKASPVMANQGQLYWSLTVNGKEHHFTAQILPKD